MGLGLASLLHALLIPNSMRRAPTSPGRQQQQQHPRGKSEGATSLPSTAVLVCAASSGALRRRGHWPGGRAARSSRRHRERAVAAKVWRPSEQQMQQLESPDYGPPKEHIEGYSAGWPKLDAVFKVRPTETTLVLPASCEGARGSARLLHEDTDAAVALVLEQAIGLACKARCNFRIFVEEGRREDFYFMMQSFNPYSPDITWLLEHFSVEVLEPGVQLGDMLAKETVVGFQRGIIFVGGGGRSHSSLLPDVTTIKKCAEKTGVTAFIVVRPCCSLAMEAIQDSCDNCLVVVPDPSSDQVGFSSPRRRYEVTPRKLASRHVASWPRGGAGDAHEPIWLRAPSPEERLAT